MTESPFQAPIGKYRVVKWLRPFVAEKVEDFAALPDAVDEADRLALEGETTGVFTSTQRRIYTGGNGGEIAPAKVFPSSITRLARVRDGERPKSTGGFKRRR
ncbi:hypothetical protein [Allomesorhizobium alhagi]|uniref:Uncharacterized protein n=1 Tax=Mesorhizobium alhagi CCNWXJ12-2 TaxID=1107882 RepID=H0HNE6_9HYPH|nr:hypothetical protein [Mesorhizobium alhagi]EHK57718.1 hypothetical protein MAXJ12_08344 [Mesorhizobium alhagi CCNWXJ12-2]